MEDVRILDCWWCNFLRDKADWLIASSFKAGTGLPIDGSNLLKCCFRQITAHYKQPCTMPLCHRKSYFICTNLPGILLFI